MWLLDEVKNAVDSGRDVILHCHAGVHRAAITTVLVLMFGLGCTLQEGREMLEAVRSIRWEEAVNATRREDGTYTEDHMQYLPDWEKRALSTSWDGNAVDIRFLPPLPVVFRMVPQRS